MMWGRYAARVVLCAGLVVLLAEGVAMAQSGNEAAARALFDEARRLRESGHDAPACAKLEEARRLFTSAGLVFNLADCYEKIGRAGDARSMFDEAARSATESGRADLAAEAAHRRDALKASDTRQAQPPVQAQQPTPTLPEGASSDEAMARALFEDGRALRDAGRIEEACRKFESSTKRFASAGVEFNLADCYAKLGRTASAWTTFRDAGALARQTRRLDIAEQAAARTAEIEPRLTRLAIHAPRAPVGLVLKRDGVAVTRATWDAATPVDPGAHDVRAEAPGYAPWSTSVGASAPGETVSVDVPALVSVPVSEPAVAIATPGANANANADANAPANANAGANANAPANANANAGANARAGADAGATPATRETPDMSATKVGWLDADVGAAYANVTLFDSSTLSLQRAGRVGPTFSLGAGIRFDFLSLGVRARDLALSAYNVWEIDGEGALHTRFDRVDGHIGFRGGYATLTGARGVHGLNMGAFFGFDYYASSLVSLGLDACPEVLWLQGSSQASLGFGFEGVARVVLHF